MIKKYKICDLIVECDFRFETMLSRSEKFAFDTEKEADITIGYDKKHHEFLLKNAENFTEKDCEVMSTGKKFYNELLNFDGFMLHSSAVMVDGKVFLFSAPSGTGKSTHTRQWRKLFGERAVIINDDKPAIRIVDGKIYAYGTPWSGSSELNSTDFGILQGICVLSRSEENYIRPLDQSKAIFSVLNQTIRPADEKKMDKLLAVLDKVVSGVKIWQMGCNISTDAAQLAYDAMSK